MRSCTVVVGFALALPFGAGLGCGAAERPVSPTQARTSEPASGAADTKNVMIVSRTAPVPKATTPGERLIFVKAGSVWMMGPDGEAPEQLTVRSLDAADRSPAVSPNGLLLAKRGAAQSLYSKHRGHDPLVVGPWPRCNLVAGWHALGIYAR